MHLLDMPKPKRAPRLPYVTLLAAVYLAAVPMWSHRPEPIGDIITCPARGGLTSYSPELVKWVTVKREMLSIAYPCYQEKPCISSEFHDKQMPLMELYDELCEIEDRAEGETEKYCVPLRGIYEHIYLYAEKQFMRKYGLTLEQVKMIKRDGYRLKHPKTLASDDA